MTANRVSKSILAAAAMYFAVGSAMAAPAYCAPGSAAFPVFQSKFNGHFFIVVEWAPGDREFESVAALDAGIARIKKASRLPGLTLTADRRFVCLPNFHAEMNKSIELEVKLLTDLGLSRAVK